MEDDLQSLITQAAKYQQDGNVVGAESVYRKALELDPDHPGLLQNLGALIALRGDPKAALDLFDRLLATEPYYASAHFNRANALQALGRVRTRQAPGLRRARQRW